ncbi:sugar transferase [Xinfangfangia sp. D13-10-4-6]|uniref:sugar transferase n=1 Tax=Pseudogemmobacter hezensis TaxID=2737662 RepID=UPI001555C771|nr:sugar transferase [Pseudogemmobacter hezensis]NPD15394.1 sugar transferase [Pseudogemmobacter hezensis]
MCFSKRLFDVILALFAGILLLIPSLLIAAWILIRSGRPIFYVAERMKTPDQPFMLWKFRTMTVSDADSGVSGGDKTSRITPEGRILRRYRLDEIPQIWNILKGDMSIVGPRPPLRQYTDSFPELYAEVLQCRPGLTGLATLHFHHHEAWLLTRCKSRAETNHVYATRCVPRKARLDLIYRDKRSLCYDIAILSETIRQVLWRK